MTIMKIFENDEIRDDLMYLKKYLQMSEVDKAVEVAFKFPDYIVGFMEGEDYIVDFEGEPYELVDWLYENDKQFLSEYGQYIIDNYRSLGIYDAELPTFMHMDYSYDFSNEVLIHFTDDAFSVAKEGFTFGHSDYMTLGLTTSFTKHSKRHGGFNFAYILKDLRYAKGRHGYKYGKEAVLFRASGIVVNHYGDEEPQAIFYGKDARNMVAICESGGGYYINSNNYYSFPKEDEDDDLDEGFDTIEEAIEWAIKNPQKLLDAGAVHHKS